MFALFSRIYKEERGVSAIEYVLVAAFIGVAIVSALSGLGQNLCSTFDTIASNR
ncbi:MAG: Flp family type IVb pilin [Alphaproteobacteria bacterium]|nr:Flp family type IVb pilin [Alphaproteobacteria bacterium]